MTKMNTKQQVEVIYDLAIIHEYTNLAKSNTKETIYDALMQIRERSRKYANLKLTAGVLYENDQEKDI